MTQHNPEYCRERAAECERLAELADLFQTQGILMDIASRWHALAEEDEAQLNPREQEGEPADRDEVLIP